MKRTKVFYNALILLATLLLTACQERKNTPPVISSPEKNLVLSDHISNQKVMSICEDKYGQIWIGTFRGLNKYDGNQYHQYYCVDDSLGLPDNHISHIYRDSHNRLWVATVNGVCLYQANGNFNRVSIKGTNKNIEKILEDKEGRIFFLTITDIYQYDENTNTAIIKLSKMLEKNCFHISCHIDRKDVMWIVTSYSVKGYRTKDLKLIAKSPVQSYPITSFLLDGHQLYLSGYNGMQLFDTDTRKWQHLPAALQDLQFPNDMINCIHPYGAKGNLLLSTTKHGLFYFNAQKGTILPQSDKNFPFEVPDMQVNKMLTDSKGNLWLGSEDDGVKTIYRYKDMFNSMPALQRAIGKQPVLSVAADRNHHLWISTKKNGLYMYDLQTQQLKDIPMVSYSNGNKKNAIINIFVDSSNHLWLANGDHVAKYQYDGNHLNKVASYPCFMPIDICQDAKGNIWVSTASVNIYCISAQSGEMTKKQLFPITLCFIPCIMHLQNGNMLISAFYKPILEMNGDNFDIQEFKVNPDDWKKCIKRSVYIPTKNYQDRKGNIWLGTVTNGLLKYDAKSHKLTTTAGISCSDISSIEEDRDGNIWVSTQYGLNKIDGKTEKVTTYNEADGVKGFQFYDRASCKLSDGTLIFGGTQGLTIFNPQNINTNQQISLLFETLKVHNEIMLPGKNGCIEESMEESPHIHLSYKQNSFSIAFSAIDYSDYKHIHYFYQMAGFDNTWIDAGNNNEAYYSNLPAGNYTFKVKMVGKDSNNTIAEKSIQVSISPEPWNSWWAWCLYLIIMGCVGFVIYRQKMRISIEKNMAQKAKDEKEQEQRINKMNMSFFANISHEFRTPLTMISGPVEQLCESESINKHDKLLLNIINRSVDRMLRLVNQLLDFNKLENDTLRLHVKQTDIITEMKRIMDLFIVNTEEKGITLNCHGLEGSYLMLLDSDKLEKIINNLMSNAMKFTPRGGKIDVSFDAGTTNKGEQIITITVADTGKGIPQNEVENIFKRYYQLNNQSTGTINWGTGIGLYYARSLAVLHHGNLKAGNRKDCQGAIFTVTLPTDESLYAANEKALLEQDQKVAFPLHDSQKVADKVSQDNSTDNRPKILIVDDDTEVVHYLRTLLASSYHIIYRFDAESALKATREEEPSLILSDVVMPGMNGYDLCKEIKQDIQLCHIPVILVTAKTTTESQVEGLNSGADAYVTKPFTPKVLLAMINSQLTNREKTKTILTNATETDKNVEEVLSPQDKLFMDELYHMMEQELANSELDVNKVTKLMHISRTKLYYKVKGLTGENPSIFFKTYKLNRAATLIVEGKYNISEIAYMTGFNTLSHFSTSFKKQFGCTPSEYSKKKY